MTRAVSRLAASTMKEQVTQREPRSRSGLASPGWMQLATRVQRIDHPLEREANETADHMVQPGPSRPFAVGSLIGSDPRRTIQRKCTACDEEEFLQRKCSACAEEELLLQRRCTCNDKRGPAKEGAGTDSERVAPALVNQVLESAGRPLDAGVRAYFEPRFGKSFADVRVHDDARAAESARAVNALAYTVGDRVVFGVGQYAPSSRVGRRLLAHELTHVVQQRGLQLESSEIHLDPSHSSQETEARSVGDAVGDGGAAARDAHRVSWDAPRLSRADPDAVRYAMLMGRTPGSGLQFIPTNVTDTRVGPVSARGGLLSGGASQLNVVIGENVTLRTLARQLLPLWVTATPFTPPGAAAPLPLDIITEDELAQGLLVYNRFYLRVPLMTAWRAGVRVPLPVEIDDVTGIATLHPLQIRALASDFDPAWAPLLDLRAAGTVAPPVATLRADVAAFLARESTPTARGMHLAARALTNAVAELPFVSEAFRQVGAAGYEVALAFMDSIVQRDVDVLGSQADGALILEEIRTVLVAAPNQLGTREQESLDRAFVMLFGAGAGAAAPPTAARSRPEKSVTIDTVRLDGSTHNPSAAVAVANAIFTQCNVRLDHRVDETATPAQTTTWLNGDTNLLSSASCGAGSVEERSMVQGATAAFGLSARIRAFFVATLSGQGSATGYARPPFCTTGQGAALRGMIVLSNPTDREDLAHEVGHMLLNLENDHRAGTLMSPFSGRAQIGLRNAQCTRIYNNA